MGLFPGRTLEELDAIDVNRLLRALEAKRLEAAEMRRRLLVAGAITGKDLTASEGALIVEMDSIMAD